MTENHMSTEAWASMATKVQRVTAVVGALGPDELEVLALVAENLAAVTAGGPRTFVREAIEEMVNALIAKQPPEQLRAALEESLHGAVYAATKLVALRGEEA